MRGLVTILAGLALGLGGLGCRSLPALPPADLSQPGWHIRQGQALWRPKKNSPEIAGELMLATRPNRDTFVQFTKTPFPMVIARASGDQWQIESPMENRRYTGRGSPPARLLWLWLPDLVVGRPLPEGWSGRRLEDLHWQLSRPATGETLDAYFNE